MNKKFYNKNFVHEISEMNKKRYYRFGFVYVIQAQDNICKIGKTTEEPKKRLKSLETGYWGKVEIVYVAAVDDHCGYESALHRLFDDYHLKGEWFELSPKQIHENSHYPQYGLQWDEYKKEDEYLYKEMSINWYRERQKQKQIEDLELENYINQNPTISAA